MVAETETLSLHCAVQTGRPDELDATSWDTGIESGLRLRASIAGAGPHPPALASLLETGGIAPDAGVAWSVEEACKRALHHFPSPDVAFPMPALEFDFRIAVRFNAEPARVETEVHKEIITVSAGRWSASFGNGRVLAGGYDLGQARGFRPIRIIEGAFFLQTTDESPAVLEMRTRGSLSGPCRILDVLLSTRYPKDIDARHYGFRMFATLKTADRRYADIVNCGLWVASGAWHADELMIEWVCVRS